MELNDIPFTSINWENIPGEEHQGLSGKAIWKVVSKGNVRVRIVEYTPGYMADHWCEKGHVVFVLDGEFTSELKDGRKLNLIKGMTYIVADNTDPHRSSTNEGVKLLIVD
jgi:quercetin dioxygenase-like cupin family protein